MQYTTNYQFKLPDQTDNYNIQNENDNWNSLDSLLKTVNTLASGAIQAGTGNSTVETVPALLFSSDTRSTNLTFLNGQLSQVTITDPTNNNAVIRTITLNFTGNQLTSISDNAGGHTVTYTLTYGSGGQLNGVTKSYV